MGFYKDRMLRTLKCYEALQCTSKNPSGLFGLVKAEQVSPPESLTKTGLLLSPFFF